MKPPIDWDEWEEYFEADRYACPGPGESLILTVCNSKERYFHRISPPKPKSLTMKTWDAFISKGKRHDDSLTMDDAMMIVHVIEEHLKEQGKRPSCLADWAGIK